MDHPNGRALDGNVLAGLVSTLVPFEPTTAQGQCDSCDAIAVLAQAAVYPHPMGFVVRCRSCDSVLMVIVERDGHASWSTRGLRWLRAADAR
ncbi:DUF6510 family protein [Microbacterium sp. PMB16]|uniref:DUF6510 family protein n=1 Tax=Microbacterium sp. PMB16 TaxID=3120157 RepID=UPI003F4B011C